MIAGCSGEIGGQDSPDAAVSSPDATVVDPPPAVLIESAPIRAVMIPLGPETDAIVAIGDDLIARRDADAWWIGTATEARIQPIGRITGGAALGGNTALVLAEDGPWAWNGHRLLASPIADALEGAAPRRAARSREGALWLATDDGVFVYADGVGRRLQPQGLPTASASIAALEAARAAWVSSSGQVYRLDTTKATLDPDAPGGVESIALDAAGTLWTRANGQLFRRIATGWIDDHRAIEGALAGWLARTDGLARVDGDAIHRIEGTAGLRLLSADARSAIASGQGSLWRVIPGSDVAILGIESGAVLTASTALVAYGARALFLDGSALPGAPFRGGLRASIAPASLRQGDHVLGAQTPGGQEISVRFSTLQGGVPTWRHDIEPFFRARCALCHGTGGNAHNLDGYALWKTDIDRILSAVSEGRMPLLPYPMLDRIEISRIDGWKSAGFPE